MSAMYLLLGVAFYGSLCGLIIAADARIKKTRGMKIILSIIIVHPFFGLIAILFF